MSTINFGIDLGTTNSVIACYKNGKVEIFKNPIGQKETLPSAVGFRGERILIGDKAREYLEKDPENVFGNFKRKMGTSESFFVPTRMTTITPVDLSAMVLKELKQFVYTRESVEAAVITIPASFDTIQSNATKKAGYEAGIQEVLLLQEPIAASLAYANQTAQDANNEGQWLVYDLGGGTFDVALVRITDGEMKVVDHQGDNFFGGLDFDSRIVDRIVIPYLQQQNRFDCTEHDFKSAKGKYNKLYLKLLLKAEEVKMQLSNREETDLEFEIEDRNGDIADINITIMRNQFESAIEDFIENTIQMINAIIKRNQLSSSSLKHVLLVGGSTYIPYVRRRIGEALGVAVNTGIDPTTAVAVGAACYAGSRTRSAQITTSIRESEKVNHNRSALSIRTAYQKMSMDTQEFFTAAIDGVDVKNYSYRIIRQDGGFDSGIRQLDTRIQEMLPLAPNIVNEFSLRILDEQQQVVPVTIDPICISHGQFSVVGQPLPNDICLEVDDQENGVTKLDCIFEKNAILPLRRKITKRIMNTIQKGSPDRIHINIVEGSYSVSARSNLPIGSIQINGAELNRDLIKGTDVEITLEMSESRDLRITTYLLVTDQEFSNLFTPTERHVNLSRLKEEIGDLVRELNNELVLTNEREDYESSAQLNTLLNAAEILKIDADLLSSDDVTDQKYQLEDRKRRISQETDRLTGHKHVSAAMAEYINARDYAENLVKEYATPEEKKQYAKLLEGHQTISSSNSRFIVNSAEKELWHFVWPIRQRTPDELIQIFYYCLIRKNEFKDKKKAETLIAQAERAIERKSYDELRTINSHLLGLLPPEKKNPGMSGTGIG
jgi:molecular chaperone DnaK